MERAVRKATRKARPEPPRALGFGNRRTSVRLEPVMWDALDDIARERGPNVHDVVAAIHRNHARASLTSAIRVFIVEYYRARDRQRDDRRCDPEAVARDIVAALDRAGF